MQIRVGYELIYECPQPTPMLLMLNIHHSRAADIVVPDLVTTEPIGAGHTPIAMPSATGAAASWRRKVGSASPALP